MKRSAASFVTILFTDIEGSTRLWEAFADDMRIAIGRHDAILDELIPKYGGRVIDHAGDGVFAVFEGGRPLECALDVQRRLQREHWGKLREIRVRMAIHAGAVDAARDRERGYVGRKAR